LKKHKASAVDITSPMLKKIGGVKWWRKASSWTSDKITEQEVLLAKPLKLSKNFVPKAVEACFSCLSVVEKASSVKTSFGLPLVAKASTEEGALDPH
jgi:hypothetical protein